MKNNNETPPLCACGCGEHVTKNRKGGWNKYILGHNSRYTSDNADRPHLFKKGQSGNPAGSKKGSKNKKTILMENLLENEAGAITEKAIEMALNGDRQMIKLILDKCIPHKRSCKVKLPGMPKINSVSDASEVTQFILDSISSGIIDPLTGETIGRTIDRHLSALKSQDVKRLIDQFEVDEEDEL